MTVPYSPNLPRTLTNLSFIPLILVCIYYQHKHWLVFTGTMLFSFFFHLQEELKKEILFSYWHWLGLDHFFSIFAIISTCCFLVEQEFTSLIWIVIVLDGFLDIYFCSIPNGKYLDYKNWSIVLLFAIFVLFNYSKIVLTKFQQTVVIIGYLLGILCVSMQNTVGHSLWHVFMALTTFLVYLWKFNDYDSNIQDKSSVLHLDMV